MTDGNGTAIKFDGLIGDAIIRDEEGRAFGYNAIPIQARSAPFPFPTGQVLATGAPTDLDGDGKLDFAFDDDPALGGPQEYKAIPGRIFGTVQYGDLEEVGETQRVTTDLILLTLDVASNLVNNVTTVGLNFYTDDERLVDTGTSFVCWRELDLVDDINVGLTEDNMGRKGLLESAPAFQRSPLFPFVPDRLVTLLGFVETDEEVLIIPDPTNLQVTTRVERAYAYSLYNDSNPIATTFEPTGGGTPMTPLGSTSGGGTPMTPLGSMP